MAGRDHLPRESIDSSVQQMSDLVPVDGPSFRRTPGQQSTNTNVFSDDFSIDSVESPLFANHRRSISISSTNSSSTIGPRRPGGSATVSDYNMQLMLLEQQNKRRIVMARQQQEDTTENLQRSTSRHSLARSHVSTTDDEIVADPFADQPTSSQNDPARRSSIRKDIQALNRQSTISTTSTRSGFQAAPRAMSPYQGATGPSHPYGMYPQIGVSRSASVATTSTIRPDGPFRGRAAPSHPYGMYSQNVDYEEDLGDRPIPMGFPADEMQNRQESTPADEVGDIVGPDGHLEQLPPYSRYPDGIVRPTTGRGPASIASAMREPQESSHDESLLRSDASSRTLINVDSSEPLVPLSERNSRLMPFDEKLGRRGQRKCCGAPIWLLALLGLGMLIGALIGGVIGGVLGRRAAENHARKNAADKPNPSSHTPTVVTITETTDVSPFSGTPTNIAALPTGKYQVPWMIKNTSKFCIGASSYKDVKAWSCQIFTPLAIEVLGTIERSNVTLDQPSSNGSHLSYGAQLPYDVNPPQQGLQMIRDKEDLELGPALFFTTAFNKLVVVEEQQITMSKRSIDESIVNNGWNQQTNEATPGAKPWYCWWNQTQLEVFIYINETQAGSNPVTTSSTTSAPPPTATAGVGANGAPQNTATAGPHKRDLESRGSVIIGNYPRKVKVKENRVISTAPQAYCQQMQVNPDSSITPIANNIVQINEVKPGTGSTKRDMIYERDNYSGPCYCEWLTI
ncbi:hypothetical protein BGW36DRAFT_429186 [Talaromyces proteolyticus]|uniref:DUF7820 domain-containing protein n=1 Tax=Talaromyces proteolyticus TaxID=1131652 RepID=A0AAD4PZ17_9EURO|nr:uncharacterized protein BGW36DRAFT_429186 [Talaromyces proteolyticus]KAH8695307.1 hypothetical protein BGW36DRAFT_429186 [Talaromyces proteolyticus]